MSKIKLFKKYFGKEKVRLIYEKHYKHMCYIAYAKLGNMDAAQDTVHDAFVDMLKKADEIILDDPEKLPAFAVYVLNCKIIDYLRSQNRFVLKENIEEGTGKCDITENVEEYLTGLEIYDAEIIRMKILQNMSYKEISQKLNIKESTLRKRLQRAKKKLKQKIESEAYNEKNK